MMQPDFLADFRDIALACAITSFFYLIAFLSTGSLAFQFISVCGGVAGVIAAFAAAWESRKR